MGSFQWLSHHFLYNFSYPFRWLLYITTKLFPYGTVGIEFCLNAQKIKRELVSVPYWGAVPYFSCLFFFPFFFSLDLVASLIAWVLSWILIELQISRIVLFEIISCTIFPQWNVSLYYLFVHSTCSVFLFFNEHGTFLSKTLSFENLPSGGKKTHSKV